LRRCLVGRRRGLRGVRKARRARQRVDALDRLELAVHAQPQLRKSPRRRQDLLFERADGLVEGLHTAAEGLAQSAEVLAEHCEALVQILAEPAYLDRIVREDGLLP